MSSDEKETEPPAANADAESIQEILSRQLTIPDFERIVRKVCVNNTDTKCVFYLEDTSVQIQFATLLLHSIVASYGVQSDKIIINTSIRAASPNSKTLMLWMANDMIKIQYGDQITPFFMMDRDERLILCLVQAIIQTNDCIRFPSILIFGELIPGFLINRLMRIVRDREPVFETLAIGDVSHEVGECLWARLPSPPTLRNVIRQLILAHENFAKWLIEGRVIKNKAILLKQMALKCVPVRIQRSENEFTHGYYLYMDDAKCEYASAIWDVIRESTMSKPCFLVYGFHREGDYIHYVYLSNLDAPMNCDFIPATFVKMLNFRWVFEARCSSDGSLTMPYSGMTEYN